MSGPVRLEREGDVGVLTMSKPPLNLFGRDTVDGLSDALGQTDGLRALVVRAEGEVFTAGVDVNVFDGLSPAQAEEFARELLELTHRFEELPFPTIACVHGLCLTAGFELSLACDLIWAARSARFGLVERAQQVGGELLPEEVERRLVEHDDADVARALVARPLSHGAPSQPRPARPRRAAAAPPAA